MTGLSRLFIFVTALVAAGCSIENPGPVSPTPTPSGGTRIAGTVTDTMTGAVVGSFTSEAQGPFPARVSVSLGGYLTRDTWVRSTSPTVDLIRDAPPFSLSYYRELVRNGMESPGALEPVRVWTVAPSVYLQTTKPDGSTLTADEVALVESAVRATVPQMTGGRFSLATFESGAETRSSRLGWILIDVASLGGSTCGNSRVGNNPGLMQLAYNRPGCNACGPLHAETVAHEMGHALGFWHTSAGVMSPSRVKQCRNTSFTEQERHHATIAYHRPIGNTDVDVDPVGSVALRTALVTD